MIQLTADDTKAFMNCLLRTEAFDNFLLYEMSIDILYHVEFSGKINEDYLSDIEKESYHEQNYITWADLKGQITALLKQGRTPSAMKITMSLNQKATLDIQQRLLGDKASYPVQGFLINTTFDGTQVKVTTGVNYSQFTMDKSVERAFDSMMEKFFKRNELLMVAPSE